MRKALAIMVVSGFLWAAPVSEVMVNLPEPTPIVLIISDLNDTPVRKKRRGRHYRRYRLASGLA
ncbi:MAG: hypothetical protein WBW16_15115 [Bacteroidota bacterium]